MRDHRKLEAFRHSDELAIDIYKFTKGFPASERYGIRSQLRRSALSVPVNIVEGCGRKTDAEFDRFLDIALGSARELQYLTVVAGRLGYFSEDTCNWLSRRTDRVCRLLARLIKARTAYRQ